MRVRKSLRLKNYDYSTPGAYFVTICSKNRANKFGEIINYEINLSEIGLIIQKNWQLIPDHFRNVKLDEFVVMPNHIHGIIWIEENKEFNNCRDVQLNIPTTENYLSRISPKKKTLSVIIRTFKGSVTKFCRENDLEYEIWQKSFYEHIIRNEKSLEEIRKYIRNNPLNWKSDVDNLENKIINGK